MPVENTNNKGSTNATLIASLVILAIALLVLKVIPWKLTDEMQVIIDWIDIILAIAIGAIAVALFKKKRDNEIASIEHDELLLKNLILTTQQETSQDAILVVNEDAMIISYNQRFIDLWGLPEEMVEARIDRPVLEHVAKQVADSEAFLARVIYLYEHREEKSFEEIELKDGRVIDRYSSPMFGKDGKYYGRIWYFRDITAKKQREREILSLQNQLRHQAIRDPLTDLYNRRYFDEAITGEIERARRHDYPISLLICDIDHFKDINDAYGHPAGDHVLKVFGYYLRQHARSSDIICRFGGDEFLVVMPEMESEMAHARAEALRRQFANPINYEDETISATASFGVITIDGEDHTGHELIAAADKALYEAKKSGRNKVTSFAA